MLVDKEAALLEWAQTNPFLTDKLLFDYIDGKAGSCSISPVSSDMVIAEYIDGSKLREYVFSLQVMLPLSDTTDAVNVENMFTVRKWQAWIEEQQRLENYPNFGPNTFSYEVVNLNNTPSLAVLYENGLAKYRFFGKITYMESEDL